MFVQTALLFALILSANAVNIPSQSTSSNSKPHIVFVMVDDWGWANVGYHRSSRLRSYTPNIDSLVNEGLQLEQHYVYNWCAPSRSAFLTGRLPIHVNDAKHVNISTHNPNDPVSGFQGVPRNMTMISAKMKEAGYATHQVGKWHVGFATPDHTPKV